MGGYHASDSTLSSEYLLLPVGILVESSPFQNELPLVGLCLLEGGSRILAQTSVSGLSCNDQTCFHDTTHENPSFPRFPRQWAVSLRWPLLALLGT